MKFIYLLSFLYISLTCESQQIVLGPPKAEKEPNDTSIYNAVDVSAKLKGKTTWNQYVEANIQYPHEVKKGKARGEVLVSMIVEKDGMLNNIKIRKSLNSACDKEALRLVALSPKWQAGIYNGKYVRSICTVTIGFNLPKTATASQPAPTNQLITFHTIPGRLVDKNGNPLSSWFVFIYGTNDGNVTYDDGHFTLDVPNQPVMVAISYHATPNIFFWVNPEDTALNIKIDDQTAQLALHNFHIWNTNAEYNYKRMPFLYSSEAYKRYMGWYPKLASDDSILNDMPENIKQLSKPTDRIYRTPDVQPTLLTTSFDWNSFVSRNMEYPSQARIEGLRGKVYICFIIEPDGSASNLTIQKGLRGDCNEAALKMVKLSRWKPCLVNGIAVRGFHSVIINFNK